MEARMSNTTYIAIGFSVIFLATTLGAALVFFFKKDISEKTNTLFLGFAAGIMIAASVWSLTRSPITRAKARSDYRLFQNANTITRNTASRNIP